MAFEDGCKRGIGHWALGISNSLSTMHSFGSKWSEAF